MPEGSEALPEGSEGLPEGPTKRVSGPIGHWPYLRMYGRNFSLLYRTSFPTGSAAQTRTIAMLRAPSNHRPTDRPIDGPIDRLIDQQSGL